MNVASEYYEWLVNQVYPEDYPEGNSYRYLLASLYEIEFTYTIPKDKNRAEDGISMRWRFKYSHPGIKDVDAYLTGPCTLLEMMVALAVRCEGDIMYDPDYGDRTGQWFWAMVVSLGLGAMTNANFNRDLVKEKIDIFLKHEYKSNGEGGLFTVHNCDRDLRNMEIWYQLCLYLDNIT